MISVIRSLPRSVVGIYRYLRGISRPIESDRSKRCTVVVEGIADPLFVGLFGSLLLDLRALASINVDVLWVHSISNSVGCGFFSSIQRSFFCSFLRFLRWRRVYGVFVDRVAYLSSSPLGFSEELDIFRRAYSIFMKHKAGPSYGDLRIDGVLVGDLIIDSYLRFKPSPRFDSSDPFLLRIIRQALRDIRKSSRYFSERRPAVYLTCYSTYIEHGIPVRVALLNGISVKSFSAPLNFAKPLTNADFYHSSNCDKYRSQFRRLDRQTDRLSEAEAGLRERFSGVIDPGIGYMRRTAYGLESSPLPDVAGSVVIFLHDFYDSPHIYQRFIFDDFWAWLTTSVEILEEVGIKFFVKPHPNQGKGSEHALRDLLSEYPSLRVLPSTTSNAVLASSGISCGVTAYGTVSHELAYFGIPSICCAKGPHYTYDFCRTATSVKEYQRLLANPFDKLISADEMRRQALEFYYMHNLNFSPGELSFRGKIASYYAISGLPLADQCFVEGIDLLRSLPFWSSFLDGLLLEFGFQGEGV